MSANVVFGFVKSLLLFVFWVLNVVVFDAKAQNLEIYVAPKGSVAYENAVQLDNGPVERRIHKAFNSASQHLNSCSNCSVTIRLAGGEYSGKANIGTWSFPETKAGSSHLLILGGWNEDFSKRSPFQTPTVLKVNPNRSDVVFSFEGRKHAFKQIVLSGLVVDTSPSNAYDAKTNSLMKSGSSTFGQLKFGYINTDSLIITDNVFMSASSGGVGGPIVKPFGSNGEVIVENNVFFNNVIPWKVASGSYSNPPKVYVVRGNTFALNWPYNADVTTSNPGALEIGNNRATDQLNIEKNIFAYNYGGAIFPQWDDTRGPKMAIKDNLFYGNGGMFGASEAGSGAIVGKFAGAATHSIFTMEDIEDDFSWSVSGNVSFDPELRIGIPKTIGMTSVGDRSEGRAAGVDADSALKNTKAESTESDLDDLSAELSELDALLSEGDIVADEAGADSVSSNLDMDLDLDLDIELDFDDYADDGIGLAGSDLKNYAPKVSFDDGAIPMPLNPDASAYGASPNRVKQYRVKQY